MSAPPPSPAAPDRNLLFGILALQAELIDNHQFAEACTAWAARKQVPLADVLMERGWLAPEDRDAVERLMRRKLEKHAGDPQASLAATISHAAYEALARVEDADVQQSLAGVTPSGPGSGNATPTEGATTTAYTPPQRRARYVLTHLHAKGGIGQVWLARDNSLGREVALKELRPDRPGNPVTQGRFLKEAQITGQLEHPAIVPVYELSTRPEDLQPFYTMRFVKGRNLSEAARAYHEKRAAGRAGPLDLMELLQAFLTVCNAIAYAHSRGVVHRDLKGKNVVLGDFGEVVVLDWGLAKIFDQPTADVDTPPVTLEDSDATEETAQGQVVGTPAFMSPEQAAGRLDLIGPRTDVYGLGAVLYEILTGRAPFSGGQASEVLRKVRHEEPTPPRHVNPEAPPALEAVCLRALAKQQADRYGSASELASEVQHWLADEPVSAYREPRRERLRRWARRHKPLVTGAAALLLTAVVALGAGVVLIGREQAETEEARAEAVTNLVTARANQKRAEDREKEAIVERARTEEQRQRAEDQRKDAEKARADAVAQQRLAEARELTARHNLYGAHLTQARQSYEAGMLANVRDLLERQSPQPGMPDLRSFEWHHFWRLAHTDRLTLRGHRQPVARLALSPDGKYLATASFTAGISDKPNEVKLWDAADGRLLADLKGLNGPVHDVVFSRDGKTLITSGGQVETQDRGFPGGLVLRGAPGGKGEVIFWDVATARPRSFFHSPDHIVHCLALSADGKTLATGSMALAYRGGQVKLWDMASSSLLAALDVGEGGFNVNTLTFSPDGKYLAASGTSEMGVKIWDAATGDEVATLDVGGATEALAFAPDGATLAAGGSRRAIKLWDVAGRRVRATLERAGGSVRALVFSPDGSTLAAGGADSVVELWALGGKQTPRAPRYTLRGHTAEVTALAFAPDGMTLFSAGRDGTVRLWDPTRDPAADSLAVQGDPASMDLAGMFSRPLSTGLARVSAAFSPDGKVLAIGNRANTVTLVDLAGPKHRLTLRGHTNWTNAVAFSPDGTTVATASWDRTARLWEASTGKLLLTLRPPAGRVQTLAFSPGGELLAVESGKAILLWDVPGRREAGALAGEAVVNRVAFSPDGRTLAAAGEDGKVTLWDVPGRRLRLSLPAHCEPASTGASGVPLVPGDPTTRSSARCVAFSPDGRILATGGSDRLVRLWNAVDGKEIVTLRGHTGGVLDLAFSPDGRCLASGGADRVVRLWDTVTGEERGLFGGHQSEVTAVAFAPDGRTLMAAGSSNPLDESNAAYLRQMVNIALPPGMSVNFASGPTPGEVKLWRGATDREMASYYQRSGEQLEGVGHTAEAEDAYRRAVHLWQRLAEESPGDLECWRELARGRHHLARVLNRAGKDREALALYRAALGPRRHLAAAFPLSAERHSELAATLNNLGAALRESGQLAASRALLRSAVAAQGTALALDPAQEKYRRLLTIHWQHLAETLLREGDHAGAAAAAAETLSPPPKDWGPHHAAAGLLARCAALPGGEGHAAAAVAQLRAAVLKGFHDPKRLKAAKVFDPLRTRDDFRKLLADVEARDTLLAARDRIHRGNYALDLRQAKDADRYFREALSLLTPLAGAKAPEFRQARAAALYGSARLLCLTGRGAEADARWEEALALREGLVRDFPKEPTYRVALANTLQGIAGTLQQARQGAKAMAARAREVELREALVKDYPDEPEYRYRLGESLNELGLLSMSRDPEAAEGAFRRAEELVRALAAERPDEPRYRGTLAGILHNRAEIRLARQAPAAARKFLEEAVTLQRKVVEADPRLAPFPRYLRNHYWALTDIHLMTWDHAAAATTAEELPRLFPYDQGEYRRAAAALARCMLLAQKDPTLSEEDRKATAARYADTAATMVGKAIRRGFEDAKILKTSPAYAPLKKHPEFERLVSELEARQVNVATEMAKANIQYSDNILTAANTLGLLGEHAEFGYQRAVFLLKDLIEVHPRDLSYLFLLARAQESLAALYRTLGRPEDGAAALREAADVYDRLDREAPLQMMKAIFQGTAYRHLEEFGRAPQHGQAALARYAAVVGMLEKLYRESPGNAAMGEKLARMHEQLARALTESGRHREALPGWDRALQLAAAARHDEIRAQRLLTQARGGDHRGAAAGATDLLGKAGVGPWALYHLGCACAAASATAARDEALTPEERERLARQHAGLAVRALQQALALGLFRTESALIRLKRDPDLNPIRDRPEFRQMLKQAEAEARGERID